MVDDIPAPLPCVYNRLDVLFFFANAILSKGSQTGRSLSEADVNDCPPMDCPHNAKCALETRWHASSLRGAPSLSWCLITAWWGIGLAGALFHLVEVILNFVSPVLIMSLVGFVDSGSTDTSYGMCLAVTFFLTPFVQSVLSTNFVCFTRRLGFRAQGSTACMIFEKVLRLSQPAAASYGAGTIVNIMQVDTFRFQFCFFFLNFLWSMPLMLVIGVGLLYNNLGLAAFTPLLVMASMYFLNTYLVRRLMDLSHDVNKARDARIRILTEVLHAIKLVKMLAWEDQVDDLVTTAREKELSKIANLKLFDVANGLVWLGVPTILPLLTFGVYVLLGGHLDPGLVFSSLALLDLVRIPMNLFPQALQVLVQVKVGVDRIQTLLLAEERRPFSSADAVPEPATGPAYVHTSSPDWQDTAVRVVEASFRWTRSGAGSAGAASGESGHRDGGPAGRCRCLRSVGRRFRWRRAAATPLLDAHGGDLEQGRSGTSLPLASLSAQPGSPDLRIAGLQVPRGKLIMVVGPVGAGKSTLVAGLLNEVPQEAGYVEVRGAVALCAQIAWIMHGTVRDNVLLGDSLDEARFEEVTRACALEADLAELADGAETVIGERGINLSGGQKARICLARAAYKHPSTDIYILDDPLSAVDMHVGKHLMDECLGSERGLLRHKTRVLVTHQVQFMQCADLVVLVRDGEVSTCRPPNDFSPEHLQSFGMQLPTKAPMEEDVRPGGEGAPRPIPLIGNVSNTSDMGVAAPPLGDGVAAFLSNAWARPGSTCCAGRLDLGGHRYHRPRSGMPLTPPSVRRAASARPVIPRPSQQTLRRALTDPDAWLDSELPAEAAAAAAASASDADNGIAATPEADETQAPPATTQEGQEEREVGALSLRVWCTYARAMGPAVALSLVAAYLTTNTTQLGSTFWLAQWSTEASSTKAQTVKSLLVYAALSLCTVMVLSCRMLLFRITSLRVSRQLHKQGLWSVLRSPMSWLDTTPTGRVINRFSQDLQRIDMELQGSSSGFTDNVVNLCISVVVVAVYVPYLFVLLLPLPLFYNAVQNRFRRTARELQRLSSQSRSPIFQGLDEAIVGVSTIRAFEKQAFFTKRNAARMGLITRLEFSTVGCTCWLATRIKGIGTLPVAAVVLVMVLQRNLPNIGITITGASVGLVLRYALQLTNTMESLLQSLSNTELCLVALERVTSYANLAQEPALVLPSDTQLQVPWPSAGEICFDQVTMRYRSTLPIVLNGISFTIPGGTSVGVVGRTGAGKSSLLQALFRMCPIESGVIRIDGQDIWAIGLHTLRKRLAIIPQDPVGFTGSLRFNLDPFGEHSDVQLMDELSKVQLKEFIESKEEGLGYHLTSGGENLSVGQRQLVCAARAFLRNSPILILDEATASVDFHTDALIQKVLSNEVKTRQLTTLTIAHRINTIMGADSVLVMDKGTAVEFGPTKKLAADTGSIFYTFIDPKAGH